MNVKTLKLGDVATFINGRAFKPSEWRDSGIPIIRIQNLTDSNAKYNYFDGTCESKYLVKNGDILISWSATLGVFEWDREDAWLNQHIFKVVFNKGVLEKDYFKFLIDSKIQKMLQLVHGSTMKHITKNDFENILIQIPSMDVQKEIALQLRKADMLLEKRRQSIAKLDQLTQSIFLDMFGDPVTNPKGWPVVGLTTLCGIDGLIIDPREEKYRTYWNIGSANIESKTGRLLDLRTVEQDQAISVKFLVNKDHVLYSKIRPKLQKVAIPGEGNYICSADIYPLMPIPEKTTQQFLKVFLLSDYFTHKASLIAESRANIPKINRSELETFEIYCPPFELQQKFEMIVNHIGKNFLQYSISLNSLEKLQKSLMNSYFGR